LLPANYSASSFIAPWFLHVLFLPARSFLRAVDQGLQEPPGLPGRGCPDPGCSRNTIVNRFVCGWLDSACSNFIGLPKLTYEDAFLRGIDQARPQQTNFQFAEGYSPGSFSRLLSPDAHGIVAHVISLPSLGVEIQLFQALYFRPSNRSDPLFTASCKDCRSREVNSRALADIETMTPSLRIRS